MITQAGASPLAQPPKLHWPAADSSLRCSLVAAVLQERGVADRFLLTWRGKLVDSEQQLNPQRIVSIGIALAGGDSMRDQGPFKLGLDSITAVRLESGLVENAREDIAGAYEYMRTHVPK